MIDNQLYSIYLHIPFCQHRCAYCDFNTYAGLEEIIPAYVDALCAEIRWVGKAVDKKLKVHTIFFGGGTPSLLSAHQVQKIIGNLNDCFNLVNSIEITLEANPGTLNQPHLHDLFLCGINRLSIGMQSAVNQDLTILERNHGIEDVANAVNWARHVGVDNINLDLIFGIPYQSLLSWQNTLAFALSLQPEHLSVYSLTIEQDTMLAGWVRRGLINTGDPDLAADMYEITCERLEQYGFNHYEISNWAKKQKTSDWSCRHNLQYWRLEPYLGLGAGAHGLINGYHTVATLNPSGYIRRIKGSSGKMDFPKTPATVSISVKSLDESVGDYMIMGLRLLHEGISRERFYNRFGISLEKKFGNVIERLKAQDLVSWEGDSLRLSPKGYLLGNMVFREFV